MLAATCGEAGVNILGLQIFPGVESVTDELVLSTPDDWTAADLADLVGRSGGLSVSAGPCTEAALTDQPTRYVQAARVDPGPAGVVPRGRRPALRRRVRPGRRQRPTASTSWR